MKKAIAVLLVAVLVLAAAFADPVFMIKSKVTGQTIDDANTEASAVGGLYKLFIEGDSESEKNVASYTSIYDISREDVTVTFKIMQMSLTRTGESITLTVSAEPLSYVDLEGENKSDDPVFFGWTNPDLGAELFETEFDENVEQNVLKFDLKYKGVTVEVPANTIIGTFKATWAKKEELSFHPGTYMSNIALTYTIV